MCLNFDRSHSSFLQIVENLAKYQIYCKTPSLFLRDPNILKPALATFKRNGDFIKYLRDKLAGINPHNLDAKITGIYTRIVTVSLTLTVTAISLRLHSHPPPIQACRRSTYPSTLQWRAT